ncbi:MAG TPA: hypothetical protein PKK11_00450 [Methanothrix sp.]|nr:hypothetical protein [Methanothrix sp.]
MAKVLEHLIRPQNKPVHHSAKALELQTAKEILAEVFQIRLSEVDEMIISRFEAREAAAKEDGLWPQEFLLEG